jgi:hypothetical protein
LTTANKYGNINFVVTQGDRAGDGGKKQCNKQREFLNFMKRKRNNNKSTLEH